jgi:predicted DNA-binding WGR domain protein
MTQAKKVLWFKDEKHDKVWGFIAVGDEQWVTFWGRRGAKLQTKAWEGSLSDGIAMLDKKVQKGYREVGADFLDDVYPDLEELVQQ